MKNFKSYGFWTALAGAVVVLINALGKCFGFAVEEQIVTDIVMAIAGVLVVFGVVSMPKNGETQEDDTATDIENEEIIEIEVNEDKEQTEEQVDANKQDPEE